MAVTENWAGEFNLKDVVGELAKRPPKLISGETSKPRECFQVLAELKERQHHAAVREGQAEL